jgi:hypothetical protein
MDYSIFGWLCISYAKRTLYSMRRLSNESILLVTYVRAPVLCVEERKPT